MSEPELKAPVHKLPFVVRPQILEGIAGLLARISGFARVRPLVHFPNFTALIVDEISRNSSLETPHQICIRHGPEHELIRVPQSHVQAVNVNIGKRNFPFAGEFANLRAADKGVAAS